MNKIPVLQLMIDFHPELVFRHISVWNMVWEFHPIPMPFVSLRYWLCVLVACVFIWCGTCNYYKVMIRKQLIGWSLTHGGHACWSALVRAMPCHLFDTKPLPEPMLTQCKLGTGEQTPLIKKALKNACGHVCQASICQTTYQISKRQSFYHVHFKNSNDDFLASCLISHVLN